MRTNCQLLLRPEKRLVFLGCGGHARSVADVYLARFPNASLIFVDGNGKPGEKILGFPVSTAFAQDLPECFIAIGCNQKRKSLWNEFHHFVLTSIISVSAHPSRFAEIGRNVFIGNFAHVGPEAKIGHNTIINTGSVVEHEVVVGEHCHIGPNAVIAGRCVIGDLVFIGAGAVIKDSVRIGSEITIGAGAVVVRDLLEPGVYAGCPAKRLQKSLQSVTGI